MYKDKVISLQLLVKTEASQKEGIDIRVNRFMIQGEGSIKYTYNNGIMAKDPETAGMNFLKALEKLPSYIRDEQKKIEELHKDVHVLQGVVNGMWSKEGKLRELKTELDAVERKILLSITSVDQNDGDNESKEQEKEKANTNNPETTKETNSTEARLHDVVAKTGMQDKAFMVKPKF